MSRSSHPVPPSPIRAAALLALLAVLLLPAAALADIQITLKNSFIEKFKNRATLDATFTVDKAHAKPNPPSKDGDLHVAGRAPEIGLATVAEVMNAGAERPALDLIHGAESSGDPLSVTGIWRLWCEHGGDVVHVQGKTLAPFTTTNPDHIFEIHPLLAVGDLDLHPSLHPIDGFTYKEASQAFQSYERLSSHIVPGTGVTTITTRMAGFNYVEFLIQLNEDPTFQLADGLAVRATVLDLDQEILVRSRRMIFAAGTSPFERVRTLHKGDMLHVVGVPRIDLALVAWRVANRSKRPGVLDWSLPYEMVIAAAFDDSPTPNEDNAAPASPAPPPPPAPPASRVTPPAPAHAADPVEVLTHLLTQTRTDDSAAGACTFTAAAKTYCVLVRQTECNLLNGSWVAGPCS